MEHIRTHTIIVYSYSLFNIHITKQVSYQMIITMTYVDFDNRSRECSVDVKFWGKTKAKNRQIYFKNVCFLGSMGLCRNLSKTGSSIKVLWFLNRTILTNKYWSISYSSCTLQSHLSQKQDRPVVWFLELGKRVQSILPICFWRAMLKFNIYSLWFKLICITTAYVL